MQTKISSFHGVEVITEDSCAEVWQNLWEFLFKKTEDKEDEIQLSNSIIFL